MNNANFKYARDGYQRPVAQLTHVDLDLRIYDDRVEGHERLQLLPRTAVSKIELDAQDLEIGETKLVLQDGSTRSLASMYIKKANRLVIILPREYQKDEKIVLEVSAICRPTSNILDGLYYDTTPEGAPPQMMSQCQQWGFQRIMPIIDDCTAKCTWRTRLEGSSRYTHLISNGDVLRSTNPDGTPVPLADDPSRMAITFVNPIPMPPYLFIVAAGTWDVVSDMVTTDSGREIRLEYLVPPGKTEGARIPMEITKDAVLWQARRLGYEYRRECYRTICMEKSNFGGMENVGNTTVITEAALIDEWTTDARLVYAHGVIVHEFEHNHCGSDVTMESPFDMWLNEAYTVNIEREYLQYKFGSDPMRLYDLSAMRAPLNGPLAVEDGGKIGRIVREGFNHPDEVVDGVTYVKAPEVLGMLQALIGEEKYTLATSNYFSKHKGGNANTEEFLDCFREVAERDLDSFFREWLFTIGYPELRGSYKYDAAKRELTVALSQLRHGGKGGIFTVPFRVTAIDRLGRPMPAVDKLLVLENEKAEFIFTEIPEAPAFIDWNSGGAFYGAFKDDSATTETLATTVRISPFLIGRVEAMRALMDDAMKAVMNDAKPSQEWLALFPEILADESLPDGIKAHLLTVSEEMLDRSFLPLAAERNATARKLRKAVATVCGEDALLAALEKTRSAAAAEPLTKAIPRRSLCNAIAKLLAANGSERAVAALVEYFEAGRCASDKLNAASAINSTNSPLRVEIMNELGAQCRCNVAAYGAYLREVASSPHDDVFDAIAREEASPGYRMEHPGHSRSLYGGMAANNAQLWTERGFEWASNTILKLSDVNENVALIVASAFQLVDTMRPPLQGRVRSLLEYLEGKIPADRAPSLHGRIATILGL